ncbi:hypothetical protein LMIY3S_00282 [Labrys miyagiensis]
MARWQFPTWPLYRGGLRGVSPEQLKLMLLRHSLPEVSNIPKPVLRLWSICREETDNFECAFVTMSGNTQIGHDSADFKYGGSHSGVLLAD